MTLTRKGRFLAGAVIIVAFAAGLPAAERGWKTPPELELDHLPRLCERIDGAPDSKFRLPLPGAEEWPVYRVLWEAREFRVALDPEAHRVRILSAEDPEFRTPAGIHLGSTLREVREKAAEEVRCGSGWNCFAALPSGWSAGFSTIHSNPATGKIEYRDPDDESRVNSLLMYGECEDPPER
jgi:hypothetical protein